LHRRGRTHAVKLFKILELLLILDELSVRNEALISFKIILSQVNPSEFENDLVEMLTRLALSDYANQKLSAINLIPSIFNSLSTSNRIVVTGYKIF
jgi:hypothetical protein